MATEELKAAIEALLFASERPLGLDDLEAAFSATNSADPSHGGEGGIERGVAKKLIEELKAEYEAQQRGFRLAEIAGGYQLVSDTRFAAYLKRFYQAREKKKLSQASLETLSVVAYRQPVTRTDIEFIRGVNVDGALKTLLEKRLVRIVGRKDIPGRPMLYGTTKEFLEHFGLASIAELPPLLQFTEKDIQEELLPPEMKQPSPNGNENSL